MGDRIRDKTAIVTGAGSVGPGIGNGKAAAMLFAREGARVMLVDYNLDAAEETRRLIEGEGGTCFTAQADVSNAADCNREHAERFGLAQLHQLRGRVGRGGEQSFCILISYAHAGAELADSRERLQTMERTQDGFEIAEKDLQLRGPCEFFGVRQAGMPTFKAADLVADGDLLQSAREEAMRISDSE